MSTESVKAFLLPSALTYYKKPFTGQNAVVYTITSNPLPSFASELVGLIARKDISASKHTNKKIRLLRTDTPLPHHRRLLKVGPGH